MRSNCPGPFGMSGALPRPLLSTVSYNCARRFWRRNFAAFEVPLSLQTQATLLFHKDYKSFRVRVNGPTGVFFARQFENNGHQNHAEVILPRRYKPDRIQRSTH
jgi:hypothetical protein